MTLAGEQTAYASRMDRVAVYGFRYFDRESREWTRAPDLATEHAIHEIAANVLPDTEHVVPASQVGPTGFLRRVP